MNFNGVDYTNNTPAATLANPNPTRPVVLLYQDPTQIYNKLPASAQTKTEINLIDNNFKMLQVWRSSLAFDFELPYGIRTSVEGLYTKVLQDVKFEQINLKDNVAYATSGPTETPIYLGSGDAQRINPNFSNFFLLTNTQQGYRYQLTGILGKTFGQLLDVSAAYTYGQSKDISNGIRNSFQSNWELNPALNVNNPALAYSNFDMRHRVVASINLHKSFAQRFTGYFTSVLTYQAGSPFTFVYNNNNNRFGNGQQNVQLAYIPRDANDINLVDIKANGVVTASAGQQRQQLNDYINNDAYLSIRRGQYAERNAARTPWNN